MRKYKIKFHRPDCSIARAQVNMLVNKYRGKFTKLGRSGLGRELSGTVSSDEKKTIEDFSEEHSRLFFYELESVAA